MKNPRGLERERYHLHRKYLKSAQYPRFDHSFACITVYQRLRYSSIPSTDVHDLKIARNDRLFGTSFSPRPLSLRRTRKEFEKNLWKKHVSFPIQTISLIFNFTGVSLEYVRIFINIRPPSLLDQMTMIAKLLHGSLTVHRARRVVFRKWGWKEREREKEEKESEEERKKEKKDDASAEGRETYDEMHLGNSTI